MTRRRTFAAVALAILAFPAAASAAPEDVAMRYVRDHRGALGLDAADVAALAAPTVSEGGNVTTVRFRQAVDGIPAADGEVRVNLAPDGSVLNVIGAPEHALDADTTPTVTAGEAVRAVQAATGSFRATVQSKAARGATRATTYSDGTAAELALDQRRLVWRVTYRSSSAEVWDAFVDARSGKVRRRVNMVKSDTNATVWENTPTAALGGTANTVNLEQHGWLAAGAQKLLGPNVHAYSDVDDDDFADAAEEIGAPPFTLPQTGFSPAGGSCPAANKCTWNHNIGGSWNTNRRQNMVQAFYFANRFHDWLAASPVNFGTLSGSFDAGSDPLQLETDDGANPPGGLPDALHSNNANMFTPPDGTPPVMQMYLWRDPGYRTVNGGDDASIVYHEYTHGLSNRLVTDAAGHGALYSPQAGAMGEGWSDWYAKDFLVSQFPGLDSAAAGDVDMGAYVDASPRTLRTQGLDCPVNVVAVTCPGVGAAGSGGYTYGDFGKIAGGMEVHADGEIWAETLWDLRGAVGSVDARRLITDGMRLSPPEPSFLDERNAILLADQAAGGGRRAAIWSVFAARGMGYYASTDTVTNAVSQDFSLPPTGADPRGRIAGTVVDSASGAGLGGASVAISGLAAGPDRLAGTTDGAGNYAIESVPARIFPSLLIAAPGYDSVAQPVSVPAGSTAVAGAALRRNWAAFPGGATAIAGPGSDDYADQGCGPDAAIDQSQGSGWSTEAKPGGKSMVVSLPAQVDVNEFVVDPAEACGDGAASAAASYLIETSTASAGGPWAVAASGRFADADRHRLNAIPAAADGVRHVRVTLRSSQGGGTFVDLSEFGVHGAQVVPDVQPPPAPTPTPVPTPPATVAPPAFSFPAHGRTTVKFKVTCAAICDVTAKLTVDRPTAKKLGLGRNLTAGSLTVKGVKAGKSNLTLKLKTKAKKALLKGPKTRTYRARIKATGNYAGAAPVSRSAQVTLKR
ncbi:M36 family metallopeptidase [Solirubrobacter ginsenosidimutans]|uniref:M36 family metallopeptidase n=1 Tax=Solirubrobacter ginsenosidimutans TaxID=490573 RepID=A0A9X3N5B5_9ACTN|nr:M36 family metallopeptidase [Solirubrobacter ginsenosidimutans]MDA0165128.1 M36 family metallopeptidase [Solirubrobacter ginsenosidimutans]